MTLKSNIDWNEIVPLLPRSKREELYLEAVTLLSQEDRDNESPVSGKTRKKRSYKKQKVLPVRHWRDMSDGNKLAMAGRKYKINKDSTAHFESEARSGKIWEHVRNSHNDIITYEGIASIAQGQKMKPMDAVWILWSKRAIDVLPLT